MRAVGNDLDRARLLSLVTLIAAVAAMLLVYVSILSQRRSLPPEAKLE
jgi:hypothetical protein